MDDDKAGTVRERLSALADGQLQGAEFARAVESAALDDEAMDAWHGYHLIGDVLRGGEQAVYAAKPGFLNRLQARMQAEVALAYSHTATAQVPATTSRAIDAQLQSANDASFRWKLMAGIASMAALAAISWNAVGYFGSTSGQAQQLAQTIVTAPAAAASQTATQPVTLAGGEPQVMIRDPRLDELLAAHTQFGGSSALQMSGGFLRNATFEAGR